MLNPDISSETTSQPLRAELRTQADLTAADRSDMFRLMTEHFENVDRSIFEHDLAEKEWVITPIIEPAWLQTPPWSP